jgi:hypothetical protein
MKELLKYIIEGIVENSDKIEINEVDGEKTVIYEIKVDDPDVGKLIGKRGRTINAIRTIAKAVKNKENKKVLIEVLQ